MLTAAIRNDQPCEKDKLWLQALRKPFFHEHAAGCAAAVVCSWACAFAGPLCYVQARVKQNETLKDVYTIFRPRCARARRLATLSHFLRPSAHSRLRRRPAKGFHVALPPQGPKVGFAAEPKARRAPLCFLRPKHRGRRGFQQPKANNELNLLLLGLQKAGPLRLPSGKPLAGDGAPYILARGWMVHPFLFIFPLRGLPGARP